MSLHVSIEPGYRLDPQLEDLIAETVVWSGGAAERAEAVCALLSCAVDAALWRIQPDGAAFEQESLRRLLEAATEHRDRVRAVTAQPQYPRLE
jgi:hypothetical protein